MKQISCFFIGHREATDELFPALKKIVEKHITQYHVTEFVVGSYGGFDRLAARAVTELKATYPQIALTLLTAYYPAYHNREIPQEFDSVFYPPGMEMVPYRVAILQANRYMIKNVDYLIAFVRHPGQQCAKSAGLCESA